nr:venom polypeptide precursor [Doratifera vulnerans]
MLLIRRNIVLLCSFLYFTELVNSSLPLNQEKSKFIYQTYLDKNQDQKLDISDFTTLVSRFAKSKKWPINRERHTEALALAKKIMDGILEQSGAKDIGYVTVDQWVQSWDEYAKHTDQAYDWQKIFEEFIFRGFDVDGNGVISLKDFVDFYNSFGLDSDESKVIFEKMSEGKPLITREHFANIWKDYFSTSDPYSPGNYLSGSSRFNE